MMEIRLRDVEDGDCLWMWTLANEENTRKNSISSMFIPWEDHIDWFRELLSSGRGYIIMEDSSRIPMGQVHYDLVENNYARVGISIFSQYCGKGIGTDAISILGNHLFENIDINGLVAYIKPDNDASMKAFSRAGYMRNGAIEKNGVQLLRFVVDRNLQRFSVGKREIGVDCPTYVVAEISSNHHKDYDVARKLIEGAKQAGADAVKLQTIDPDGITIDCDREEFIVREGLWKGKRLYDLYKDAQMPWEWQPKLKEFADNIHIDLFSTPFDKKSVDFLFDIGVSLYKVSSFEIVDLPLIRYIAEKGRPIIMSSGMATKDEIRNAVLAAVPCSSGVAIMRCSSAYPSKPQDLNLTTIVDMHTKFGVPVGFSDHTSGIVASVVAVSLGACIIEKHISLHRDLGLDSQFSVSCGSFKNMVRNIRIAEKCLGEPLYGCSDAEKYSYQFRRSLFAIKDIKMGEKFTLDNVGSRRPNYGCDPNDIGKVIGKVASVDMSKGTPICFSEEEL